MSKRQDLAVRRANKQQLWLERTSEILQLQPEIVLPLLAAARTQSVRINPLRGKVQQTAHQLQALGWLGEPYTWAAGCYALRVPIEQLRDSEFVADGRIFIQNAASWLPVIALDPRPGESILDVCAAPGGKTSHIAALTDNQSYITANDNSRPRLAKMQANLARLGVSQARVTLYDATQIGRKLSGELHDKILLDAPCSGEGLMRYGQGKDFDSWSVAHIKRLSKLQKTILGQAWQLLKPGGTLVYSTCTMAPEENEAVVDHLLRTHPEAAIQPLSLPLPNRVPCRSAWNGRQFDARIADCLRLRPSPHIEAFFVCILRKQTQPDSARLALRRQNRYDDA